MRRPGLTPLRCRAILPAVLLLVPMLAPASPADQIARGGYLVRAMGCADCHTPMTMGPQGPVPDFARGLSGHPQGMALPPAPAAQGPWGWGGALSKTAFWGPWGTSYASNLTPHASGLGGWTEAEFIGSMRNGKHRGSGRPVAPPMPWPAFSQLNDADLKAMFAYLMAQPAVSNEVPPYQPPAK